MWWPPLTNHPGNSPVSCMVTSRYPKSAAKTTSMGTMEADSAAVSLIPRASTLSSGCAFFAYAVICRSFRIFPHSRTRSDELKAIVCSSRYS